MMVGVQFIPLEAVIKSALIRMGMCSLRLMMNSCQTQTLHVKNDWFGYGQLQHALQVSLSSKVQQDVPTHVPSLHDLLYPNVHSGS